MESKPESGVSARRGANPHWSTLSSRSVWLLVLFVTIGAEANAQGPAPGANRPPPAVVVAPAHVQPIERSAEFIARVQAIQSVEVRARVEGHLLRVAFEEGQDLAEGDLLYVIDPAQYQAAVAAAQAQLASAQASLQQAQENYGRQNQLFQRGNAPEATLEQARAQQAVAQANVEAAQAQLTTAKLNLDYTRITAPIAGRIGATSVTRGNLVSPGSGTLATIVQLDPIRVVFSINERQLVAYKQKHPQASQEEINARFVPSLQLPDGSTYAEAGTVTFVDNRVDPATGTLAVYASFPNPRSLLLPGMLATAVVRPETLQRGILVSSAAIQQDREGKYVLVVGDDNKVERRAIETGAQVDQRVAVTKGIREGDAVIVEGIQKVRPGQVVAATVASASAGATTGSSR
ncbi:efflux RND transporter periplasmic adaptor subunit [Xanthobacteraceae bacterium Astr-EGSB]|uniref:efflux RND transporter periplasmic adaptor subunit n=1 Tax=Astrobacterium formosum TaxID=3069710 RepID=UPI0027B5AF42|nr:efflux RND transporter periplasmic adaptor subunit [Xanthobacteraceae bacterium Astr-EGSB]